MAKYEMRRQSPVKQQAVDQVVPPMEVGLEPSEVKSTYPSRDLESTRESRETITTYSSREASA